MWIVILALRRPDTFMVMALLTFVLGGLAVSTMSTDILPDVDLPVVNVIWTYTGLPGAFSGILWMLIATHTTFNVPSLMAVAADGTMHCRAIKLGRDLGKTVEVVNGLKGDENLVINPMTDLPGGEKVDIAAHPPKALK